MLSSYAAATACAANLRRMEAEERDKLDEKTDSDWNMGYAALGRHLHQGSGLLIRPVHQPGVVAVRIMDEDSSSSAAPTHLHNIIGANSGSSSNAWVYAASSCYASLSEQLATIQRFVTSDISALSRLIGVSRPTTYEYLRGGEPARLASEVAEKIDRLYQMARLLRDGFVRGPVSVSDIAKWLDLCLDPSNRKTIAKRITEGRTTYGTDPAFPGKIVRSNPDGSRDLGVLKDGQFVVDREQ